MKKTIVLSLVLCAFLMLLFSCKSQKDVEIPKDTVSFSLIKSAIKAQIKADRISQNIDDTAFEGEMLPEYYSLNKKNSESVFNEEIYLSNLTEAVVVLPRDEKNADFIAVFKAKDGTVSDISKALRGFAEKNAEKEHYTDIEKKKIKNTIIEHTGNYIVYITYSKPSKMKKAIWRVIQ